LGVEREVEVSGAHGPQAHDRPAGGVGDVARGAHEPVATVVEEGDETPSDAGEAVEVRLSQHPDAIPEIGVASEQRGRDGASIRGVEVADAQSAGADHALRGGVAVDAGHPLSIVGELDHRPPGGRAAAVAAATVGTSSVGTSSVLAERGIDTGAGGFAAEQKGRENEQSAKRYGLSHRGLLVPKWNQDVHSNRRSTHQSPIFQGRRVSAVAS
jgi:hypothetical protein